MNKIYVTEEEATNFLKVFGEFGISFFEDKNGKFFKTGNLKITNE